jgi:hypothetical protein
LIAGPLAVTVGAALTTAAVVKVQLVVTRAWFAESRIAVAPPVSVAVYCVLSARFAVGFSVATRVVAS